MKKGHIVVFAVLFFVNAGCLYGQNSKKSLNEENFILNQKFKVELGVFYPLKEIKLSANGSVANDEINFGESFGFDDKQVTSSFKFSWRFSKKWNFSTEYFGLKSTGIAELDEDINWNEFTFKQGSYAKAGFGMGIYRVFFGRVLSNGPKYEFGIGVGTHIIDTNAFIEGEAYINNEAIGFKRSEFEIVLPLPNIGIWGMYAPSQKWSFSGNIDWFGIKINEFAGLLWDIEPKVNFEITKNFGLGLSYKFVQIGVKDKSSNWNGKINTIFQGPSFSIHGNF